MTTDHDALVLDFQKTLKGDPILGTKPDGTCLSNHPYIIELFSLVMQQASNEMTEDKRVRILSSFLDGVIKSTTGQKQTALKSLFTDFAEERRDNPILGALYKACQQCNLD